MCKLYRFRTIVAYVIMTPAVLCNSVVLHAADVTQDDTTITISDATYRMVIARAGFRFAFTTLDGRTIAPAHGQSGLVYCGADAVQTQLQATEPSAVVLEVIDSRGQSLVLTITLHGEYCRLAIAPGPGTQPPQPHSVVVRTGGITPAYGLGDHAGLCAPTYAQEPPNLPLSAELTGYVNEEMRASHQGESRLISNFVIFPRHRFAEVNIDPGTKIVRVTHDQNAQGSYRSTLPRLYYFFGESQTIYRNYLAVRAATGHPVHRPKYAFFGVGWEAWGALEWNTNQQSVTEHVNHYLQLGFPLNWMVIGSGFWPNDEPRLRATTSFGMWDPNRYPAPQSMINAFHQQNLKVILGLRIGFITDGPYSADGLARDCFITEQGQAKVFNVGFPKSPVYLLDASKPHAVQWYLGLCGLWRAFGVDGFKEDLYGYGQYGLPDDKIDPVNAGLMDQGVYVMGRNGYLGSPMDLHRIEDFNYNQIQDRGPINGLCLAFSGHPNVYPDVLGGAPSAGNLKGQLGTDRAKRFLMRQAQYAAVNPSMAFGLGVWETGDNQVVQVTRDAAKLHARLQPYIYSAAVDAWRTGFPYPMTPLPLLWPDDPQVHVLANTTRKGYQWLIGESLLAVPLYGDDYPSAQTRDVYLPAGTWMDYDTGEVHTGPGTLPAFPLPIGKTPLFVGGKGMLVERDLNSGALLAVVYPIGPVATNWSFTHPEGTSTSVIERETLIFDTGATVRADNGDIVPFTKRSPTGAITFAIQPGRNYRVVYTPSGSNASPAIVSAVSSSSYLLADNSTQYSITLTAEDGNGLADLRSLRAIFHNGGAMTPENGRGYLAWGLGDGDVAHFGGSWTLMGDALGGGRWGWRSDSWGTDTFITAVSCATSTSGNRRTCTWTFKAKPAWAPATNQKLRVFAHDVAIANTGWVETSANYAVQADMSPTILTSELSPYVLINDNAIRHTVILKARESSGGQNIGDMRVMFHNGSSFRNENARGYLAWGATDADITSRGGTWNIVGNATGGGRWGWCTSEWGMDTYFTPTAATTSWSGNERTVVFEFKVKPAWSPAINQKLRVFARNMDGTSTGWIEYPTSYNVQANAAPAIVSNIISSYRLIADNSTPYTITLVVKHAYAVGQLRDVRVMCHNGGAMTSENGRGYLAWGLTDGDVTHYGGSWTLMGDAVGGGRWGWRSDGWGADSYITPLSAATTVSGNDRTVVFTFKVKPAWAPALSQALRGLTREASAANSGWVESSAGYNVLVKPSVPSNVTASPSAICPGQSSTLSAAPGAEGDQVQWFTGSCGGTLLGTGNQTVSPTATTTYHVRTRNSADGRVSDCVTATVVVDDRDTDHDGVADCRDMCPNTIPGATVDTSGCPPALGPDFNRDGDVDQEDFGHFQACMTGPALGPPASGCEDADFDGDHSVDMADFGIFQRCLSGPNVPADSGCVN